MNKRKKKNCKNYLHYNMEQTLDISFQTIIKIFVAGFVFYILFLARDIVVWFFFALIISILLDPAINFLRWLRLPKIISVILVYLSIFGILGFLIYLTAPVFIFEINQLYQNIPDYFEKLNPIFKDLGVNIAQNFEDFTSTLVSGLQKSSVSVVKAISVFFGGITSTIFIFTLAFFISLEEKGMERMLSLLAPKKHEDYVLALFERVQFKVAGWFGARILACLFVGIVSLAVFLLLGIKYSFTLALISGVLTFVPFVGPLVTALLAVLFVGASNSWLVAAYVVVALTVIQEVENKFLSPLLMKKFINLPPVLVLLSLLVGGTMFGVLGMIFVVPVFGIIYEFLKEFLEKKRQEPAEF